MVILSRFFHFHAVFLQVNLQECVIQTWQLLFSLDTCLFLSLFLFSVFKYYIILHRISQNNIKLKVTLVSHEYLGTMLKKTTLFSFNFLKTKQSCSVIWQEGTWGPQIFVLEHIVGGKHYNRVFQSNICWDDDKCFQVQEVNHEEIKFRTILLSASVAL